MLLKKLLKLSLITATVLTSILPDLSFAATPPAIKPDLSNVIFSSDIREDIKSWPATISLSVQMSQEDVRYSYDKLDKFAGTLLGADPSGNPVYTVGNGWIFVWYENSWYATTTNHFRPNNEANTKSIANEILCAGIGGAPLLDGRFSAKKGDQYGFMVSGLARGGAGPADPNEKQRSAVVMATWNSTISKGNCGTSGSTQPQLKIDSITPTSGKIGDQITITGSSLDKNVMFFDSNGNRDTVAGSINSGKTEVKATVPNYLIRGQYTIKVGTTPQSASNGVLFTITQGATPTVTNISPLRATTGEQIEITGSNLTSNVELESIKDGKIYTTTGITENERKSLIFEIPDVASGSYKVSVVSPDGKTPAPKNILVSIGGGPITTPTSPGIPTEGLGNFGDLIELIFAWSLRLLGLSIFLIISYSGFQIFIANGNVSVIKTQKERIKDALIGGVILLAAYLILYTINPDLVRGGINLPGLE